MINFFKKIPKFKKPKVNLTIDELISLSIYSLIFGIFGVPFLGFIRQFMKNLELYSNGNYELTKGESILFLGVITGIIMFSKILFKSKYGFWIMLIFVFLGAFANVFLFKL